MPKKFFYPLLENPYRKKDLDKAIKVIKTGRLTIGDHTDKFEKKFTEKMKTKYSLMVNSGSSANLLALQCLINPYRKKRLKEETLYLYQLFAGQHRYGHCSIRFKTYFC